MGSTKRLRSVVHSIAQHGMSSLSWLHPHAGQWAAAHDTTVVCLDPLVGDPLAAVKGAQKPLALAAAAFQARSRDILASESFSLSELAETRATFRFEGGNEWPSSCHVEFLLTSGRRLEVAIGPDDERVEIPRT